MIKTKRAWVMEPWLLTLLVTLLTVTVILYYLWRNKTLPAFWDIIRNI